MDVSKLWVTDPSTRRKSVSLTILVLTLTLVIAACCAEMLGWIKTTSASVELFMSAAALYFGRKFTYKGQDYGSDQAKEIEVKLQGK